MNNLQKAKIIEKQIEDREEAIEECERDIEALKVCLKGVRNG